MKKFTRPNSDSSGNALFAVFGAVVLVGLVGASVNTFLKGPLTSAVKQTRMNSAKAQMQIAAQVGVMASAAGNSGAGAHVKVFQISSTSTGRDLGGLVGADAMCQSNATAAGLTGTYKAWLSDTTQSPATRFNKFAVPYKMTNGVSIANNWSDLTDGTLLTNFDKTANGGGSTGFAMLTNTKADGTAYDNTVAATCSNWTSGTGSPRAGASYESNSKWTDNATISCVTGITLYCVGQSVEYPVTTGDCDNDGIIEPLEWTLASGGVAIPIGGGLLPTNIGISSKDPWGTPYGYCSWDYGSTRLVSGCQQTSLGTNMRLSGSVSDNTTPVVAIISAGPDRKFTTTCRSYAAADVNSNNSLNDANDLALVGKANAQDDDVILTYTYDQAMAASGGLWSLKSGNTIASAAKNIEAQSATFTGTGLFQSLAASVGTFVDAVSGLRLADPTKAALCDSANAYALRRNATNDGIEICNGTAWVAIAGGSGGGGSGPAPVIDPPPTSENKVFITSLTYNGNLGGLSGADQKCQRLADKAGLPGKYMAWLSDDVASPSTRFVKSTVPYKLVDGTTIANNWTDLTDANLAAPINKTETGAAGPSGVWTYALTNGTSSGSRSHCWNWTDSAFTAWMPGAQGDPSLTTGQWTMSGTTGCHALRALFCFQQTEGSTSITSSKTTAGAIDALTDSATDYSTNKIFMGAGSGNAGAGGSTLTAFGLGAMPNVPAASYNVTAFGYNALTASQYESTAFGVEALQTAPGDGNVALGYQAMKPTPSGVNFSTAVGSQAMMNTVSGSDNVAMGYRAGKDGGLGAFGAQALSNSNSDSGGNLAAGYQAGYGTTGAYYNVTVGSKSAYTNTLGYDLVAVGNNSYGLGDVGNGNTATVAIGHNTLASVTLSGYNTILGHNAGYNAMGEANVALGKDALMGASGGGNGGYNAAIGSQAMRNNTTGSHNTAAGYGALMANTTGMYNSAAGYLALAANTTGTDNSAMGVFALYSLANGSYNSAVGYQVLKALTTGTSNTAIGYNAGLNISSGSYHTLIGSEAQMAQPSGDGTTAVGYQALKNNTGAGNTAIGHMAATALVSGGSNVIIGSKALLGATEASGSTAIGFRAMASGGGIENTAIGVNALAKGSGSGATYGYNTAMGESALMSLTGNGSATPLISYSTAIGHQALMNTTSGVNTASGYQSMKNNINGTANTAAGAETLLNNIGGSYNSALGGQALYNNTYGSYNTAIGYNALYNSKGSFNTAIGYEALKGVATPLGGAADCSGLGAASANDPNTGRCYFRTSSSVTVSNGAARCITEGGAGAYPVAISNASEQALINTILPSGNAWIAGSGSATNVTWAYGDLAGTPIAGTNTDVSIYTNWQTIPTPAASTCVVASGTNGGRWSLLPSGTCSGTSYPVMCMRDPANFEQSYNTALGYQALTGNTTGSYNTALGSAALAANTSGSYNTAMGKSALASVITGSRNTAIGFQAGPNGDYSNTTSVGYAATTGGDNNIRLGNGSITAISGQVAITSPSDKRLKQDIEATDLGLDFIMKLKPVSYRLKGGNGRIDYGFIAQDIEEALDGRVTNMLIRLDDKMRTYQMRATDLQAPLIKALQEQEEMIERLEQKVAALKLARRTKYCHAGNPTGGGE